MDIVIGNGHGNLSLNQDEAVFIQHNANTFTKLFSF